MKCDLDRKSMSPTVQELLRIEEVNGARAANFFRYGICVLISFVVVGNSGNTRELITNLLAFSLFVLATIIHTVILRRKASMLSVAFNYFTLIFDFILMFGILVYYSIIIGPGNPAHALKNPILFLLIIPIALTALQFRARLVFLSIFLFLICWFSLLGWALHRGVPLTNNWNEYLLGPSIILNEVALRPIPFIVLALVLAYTTYRAISMIRRIGDVESRRASLARFFSPDVVEELSAGESALGPGVRQKVTILFSDIRNFTRMSEGMDPAGLASFLTDFRNRMTDAIFAAGGTIDKFVGDAIMATFGTPHPSPVSGADSRSAVEAGIGMMKALSDLNQQREQSGLSPVGIGIGIHTGEVFCGTVGSEGRMEYTVIGDAVNTASRIESLCKFLKTNFLISDAVFADAGDGLKTEKMPLVRVKGKEQPVQVYRVVV